MMKLIGFEYPPEPEEILVPTQVRVCYMGSFVEKPEAEAHREEFYSIYGEDIEEGHLVVIQDDILELNARYVVRIMAENAQMEFDFNDE